jgi:hypothetical protein
MGRAKYIRGTVSERFWPKVDKRDPDECWLWNASLAGNGYGQFVSDISRRAHVVAYVLTYGPVPPDCVVHHTCNRHMCCNPKHLVAKNDTEHRKDHSKAMWVNAERGLIPGFIPLRGSARRYKTPDGTTISQRQYYKLKEYIAKVADGKKVTNSTALDVYRQMHKLDQQEEDQK